jgi:4-hydroxy-tetrahydrodipicolinate synthase
MSRALSTWVCTVTPFDEDGSLSEEGIRALIDRLGAAGIGPYLGSASPGEGHALSLAETEQLYGIALDAMAGRAPVRAMGVECRTVEQYFPFLDMAASVGLDAVQLYCLDCGHGNVPTPSELEHYFCTLLEHSQVPCVLSSHMFNGYFLSTETIDRLITRFPHLAGINVTTVDFPYLLRVIETADGRIDVHTGGPQNALVSFAFGGQGFLTADGSISPRTQAAVVAAAREGRQEDLFRYYTLMMQVFAINRWPGGSMRWLKAALAVTGQPGTTLRGPFEPLDAEAHRQIGDRLEALGILEAEGLRR